MDMASINCWCGMYETSVILLPWQAIWVSGKLLIEFYLTWHLQPRCNSVWFNGALVATKRHIPCLGWRTLTVKSYAKVNEQISFYGAWNGDNGNFRPRTGCCLCNLHQQSTGAADCLNWLAGPYPSHNKVTSPGPPKGCIASYAGDMAAVRDPGCTVLYHNVTCRL